jgi:arylsulfatase A-like enzyme
MHRTMKKLCCLTPIALATLAASLMAAEAPRPNMIVIMADDLGYSDIGCYGSEIVTPHLDRLAAEGLRFRQFYNTSKCHTSRVSLMTGEHPFQVAKPGTKGFGDRNIHFGVSMGRQAGLAGYFSAAVGKWDVNPDPIKAGFDRYFGFLSGVANYWNGASLAKGGGGFTGPCDYCLDDAPLDRLPEDFYATDAFTDHALQFMGEAGEKPFFLYLAYSAPHYPLQAPEADVRKYRGRYLKGWKAVRQARIDKMRQIGLLPAGAEPCSSEGYRLDEWDALTADQKDWQDLLMATHAAMVDRMDQNIGRLIGWLKAAGKYDNTLILFCSDNGACPMNLTDERAQREKQFPPWDARSFMTYGTRWAHVSNTPYRLYKATTLQGGITGPGIAHWPAGITVKPGSFTGQAAHLVDCMPTLIEISGGTYPKDFNGVDLKPLAGTSLVPAFSGKPLQRTLPLYFRYGVGRALIDGPWKIVSMERAPWALYQLADDPCERTDVASQHPEVLTKMDTLWWNIAQEVEQLPETMLKPIDEKKRGAMDAVDFPVLKQGEGQTD